MHSCLFERYVTLGFQQDTSDSDDDDDKTDTSDSEDEDDESSGSTDSDDDDDEDDEVNFPFVTFFENLLYYYCWYSFFSNIDTIHRMKMTTTMMTDQTAPAAHHQKKAVTLIQTNLSHPLLEGAVQDTPPCNTLPIKHGGCSVAVSSQHAVILLPIFTGQETIWGPTALPITTSMQQT